MTGCPPGPERVLEQEADHVVLGEELRHRAEVGAADLALGGVDLVLLLALPVLVDPAEAIVRGEDLLRERLHDRLEREPRLGRESKPDAGIVEAEDPRQDLGREASGHSPRIGLVQLGGELGALGKRHRRPILRDGSAARSRRGSERRAGGATARRRTPRAAARSTHPRLPAAGASPAARDGDPSRRSSDGQAPSPRPPRADRARRGNPPPQPDARAHRRPREPSADRRRGRACLSV